MGILSGILSGGGAGGSTRNAWFKDGRDNDVVFDAVNDERGAHNPKIPAEKVAGWGTAEIRAQTERIGDQLEEAMEAAESARADGEKVTAKELLDAFWEGWELRAVREIRVDDEKARREDEG